VNNLIYIADNDATTRKIGQHFLEQAGFEVIYFENGDDLYQALQHKPCSVAILDSAAGDDAGNIMIGAKIKQFYKLPVIILTEDSKDEDQILGLSLGIDAFLLKPANPLKLVTHIRSLQIKTGIEGAQLTPPPASRPSGNMQPVLQFADICLCPNKLTTSVNGSNVCLTGTEFRMLKFMLKNHFRAISRDELLKQVWGERMPSTPRATDDVIKRLRKKIATAASRARIDVVWGYGFRLSE
jgi:DNA-binding response OmpR family regulator